MFQKNVFCFTPKGSIIKLPKDATPIDFAYAVHTKIGDTATGCLVNGIEKDLQTILRNGDMVKIITSKKYLHHYIGLTLQKQGKREQRLEDIGNLETLLTVKESKNTILYCGYRYWTNQGNLAGGQP